MRELEIEAIEQFAIDGTVTDELDYYLRELGVANEDREAYRQYLQTSANIDPIVLNRLLNSRFGDEILNELGSTIQTMSGLNGKSSLRAAITQASLGPDGLTPLNVLRQLPTDLLIDFGDIRSLYQATRQIIDGTSEAIENIRQLSAEETSAQLVNHDYSELPDLRLTRGHDVARSRFQLEDASRDRQFYVDVYQPRQWRSGKTPVVVFSHGLGDSPEVYRREAEHLASYGFFVAVPQHPGSDSLQQAEFRRGTTNDIYQIDEFIERPTDITYLLDELESRNATEYEGRLDLENVGMGGHSFGGYTALALAGATIDFENLIEDCNQKFKDLNISLLLQCDALELPKQDYSFRDSRITSVAAKNPITSSVFGADGLADAEVPVMLLAGSLDPVTPAIYEQFRSFQWFKAEPRYLVLMEGQAHIDISALDVGVTRILDLFESLSLAPSEQLAQYSKALSVAFFETYAARRTDYRLYLRSAYADYVSQEQPFKIYLISEGSSDDLISQQDGPHEDQ
jgi:predicted dienelactone hydrolase